MSVLRLTTAATSLLRWLGVVHEQAGDRGGGHVRGQDAHGVAAQHGQVGDPCEDRLGEGLIGAVVAQLQSNPVGAGVILRLKFMELQQ